MYDPNIGRWLSEDPIGFDAGDANLYRYVGNEATKFVDPNGLAKEEPGKKPGWGIIPWIRRNAPQSRFRFEIRGLPNGVQLKIADDCRGDSAIEFLRALREARRWNRPLDFLIIKGHGDEFGVFDNDDWRIIVVEGRRIFVSNPSTESKTDITDLLRNLVDENTAISLRACDSSGAAERISRILGKNVKVSGFTTVGPGIPWSDAAIGPWNTWVNGEELD